MHFPLGSNDRNRERNENRNNANRLFDSQNNAKGGVPWCGDRELIGKWDGFRFYTGSTIRFEWTAQHGAGPNNDVDAQVIIQAGCDKLVGSTSQADFDNVGDAWNKYWLQLGPPSNMPRDGYPTGALAESDANNAGQYKQATFTSAGQNGDGTNTVPAPASLGIQAPNFGGTALDTNPAVFMAFYDNLTASNGYNPIEFGVHENMQYYLARCVLTSRNRGLYTADQQLNGNDARFTRQENNGNRHGFECTEERDYYPWWQPSPWVDIAVLVSHAENWQQQCAYYQKNSQNVAPRSYCAVSDYLAFQKLGQDLPLTQEACLSGNAQNGAAQFTGGKWVTQPAWGLPAPDCLLHPFSRDNHLGNAVPVKADGKIISAEAALPEAAHYDWTVPASFAGATCVFRIRYNMSSADYPQSNWNDPNFIEAQKETAREKIMWNSRYNCPANTDDTAKAGTIAPGLAAHCQNSINDSTGFVPGFNRPYVMVGTDPTASLLAIAYNSDQVARTFQDRSYVIKFETYAKQNGRKIVNLNNRGRRGNIVQCYPAVENDFFPTSLTMTSDDLLHIQFCGSDFNPNNNPNNGEGWQFSTRYNMIATKSKMSDFPQRLASGLSLFGDKFMSVAKQLAFAGIDNSTGDCVDFQSDNGNAANNNIKNCAKLNKAKAKLDIEPLEGVPVGTHYFMSTRNNNFSNRENKGVITVTQVTKSPLSGAAVAGISVAVSVVVIGAAVGGVIFYAKKNPNSRVAGILAGKKTSGTTAVPL